MLGHDPLSTRPLSTLASGAPAEPPPDQTQAVQGTRAWGQKSRQRWTAAVLATALLRGTVEAAPESLPAQPSTWTQSVQGVTALRRSTATFSRRAGVIGSALYANHGDQTTVGQWTQAVVGTTAIRTAHRRARARVLAVSPLLWQTAQDTSAPLATQPEPPVQPIQGVSAFRVATQQQARRAAVAGTGLYAASADLTPVVVVVRPAARPVYLIPRTPIADPQTHLVTRDWLHQIFLRLPTGAPAAPVTFASLPSAPLEGVVIVVTDSTTDVWGAVITGGGAFRVLAFWNGTDWTVAGK